MFENGWLTWFVVCMISKLIRWYYRDSQLSLLLNWIQQTTETASEVSCFSKGTFFLLLDRLERESFQVCPHNIEPQKPAAVGVHYWQALALAARFIEEEAHRRR